MWPFPKPKPTPPGVIIHNRLGEAIDYVAGVWDLTNLCCSKIGIHLRGLQKRKNAANSLDFHRPTPIHLRFTRYAPL